ncbi:MAG: hypothetical protein F4X62_15005 [Caldilineaceae bacterium SB0662_bin_25]|nr:hypothetical protein [Caldilineaceae bacterium SB0662_bin_25]
MESWLCHGCDFFNRSSAAYCGRCGRPADVVCAQCGRGNPGGHEFCDGCGGKIYGGDSAGEQGIGIGDQLQQLLASVRRKVLRRGLVWETGPHSWRWSPGLIRAWAGQNRWELTAVVLLTVAAAFLRVFRLEDIPAGFHGDEAVTGIEGLRILQEGWIGPYTTSALGQLTGPFYLTALMIWLLDASKFAVRLSMGLFGIATVPAAYYLLRVGFGRWIALFGTSALTVSYWHLHFSRLGFGVVPLAFASTAAAGALVWAMKSYDAGRPGERRRNLWSWFAAGVLLGLIPYTYFAFPTFLAAMAASVTHFIVLQRESFRRKVLPVSLLVLGAALSAAPVLQFAAGSPGAYFGRMNQKSVWDYHEYVDADGIAERAGFIAERVWEALSLLLRNPRVDGVDGIGGVGALDLGMALLAYFGLFISLRKWRSPPHFMAVLVVLGALSGLVLTDPSAGSMRRSITAIPWVFGLAGVGAGAIVQLGNRYLGQWGRSAAVGASVLVLLVSVVWNLSFYFIRLPNTSTFKWTFATYYFESLEAAHSFEDPGTIYYFSGQRRFGYETIRFLYPKSHGIDRSREFGMFDLEKLDPGPVTYLLEGPYVNEIDRIMEMYPGGELIVDEGPEPLYVIYHLKG